MDKTTRRSPQISTMDACQYNQRVPRTIRLSSWAVCVILHAVCALFVLQPVEGTGLDLNGCQEKFDIAILLDSSISMRDADPIDRPLQTWKLMTNFTRQFVERLPLDKDIGVAVLRFSSQSQVVQALTKRRESSQDTLSSLERLAFVGGNTYTAGALLQAKTVLGGDPQRRRVVILLTDGLSTIGGNEIADVALDLTNDSKVEVYAVGISRYIDTIALSTIVSKPTSKYLIKLVGIGLLNAMLDRVLSRVCEVPEPTPAPPPPCVTIEGCSYCLQDSRICEECKGGFYKDGWICPTCPQNCVNCTSSSNCVECAVGFYRDPVTGICTKCLQGLDLAFLIDTSGSIRDKNPKDGSYDNYQIILQFVANVIDRLPIGRDDTRIAVITFSNSAKVYFRLNNNYNREDIKRAVMSSPYEGSFTNTSGALRLLYTDVFKTENGDRPGVKNIGIIITDGESTKDKELTIPEASTVKALGATLFAVGVTNQINRNELIAVASKPETEHFFYSDDIFSIRDNVLQKLANTLCNNMHA